MFRECSRGQTHNQSQSFIKGKNCKTKIKETILFIKTARNVLHSRISSNVLFPAVSSVNSQMWFSQHFISLRKLHWPSLPEKRAFPYLLASDCIFTKTLHLKYVSVCLTMHCSHWCQGEAELNDARFGFCSQKKGGLTAGIFLPACIIK